MEKIKAVVTGTALDPPAGSAAPCLGLAVLSPPSLPPLLSTERVEGKAREA
jgi:hypothetical protein